MAYILIFQEVFSTKLF